MRYRRLGALAMALALGACSPPPAAPTRSGGAAHTGAAASGAPSGSAPGGDAEPRSGPESPVVLAVDKEGLVRLEHGGARPIYATKNGLVGLGIAPDGAVFASFYEDGTILARADDGAPPRKLGPERYRYFGAISATDAWGVTDGIEWEVHRFDGASWRSLRTRRDFPGKYDDNKIDGFARDASGEVWVSSWNGLFRWNGGAWTRAVPPAKAGVGPRLATVGGALVVNAGTCWALATDAPGAETWRESPCPGPSTREKGEYVNDLEVDARGRTWTTSDLALSVFDPTGAPLVRYGHGTIAGVTGPIVGVAIAGAGIARLPAPLLPGVWTVKGRVRLYTQRVPMVAVPVRLCPGIAGCRIGAEPRATATAVDGTFSFANVVDGVYDVALDVPAGHPDCEGVFTSTPGATIKTPRGCDAVTRTCDLGDVVACQPFEMPPPIR